MKRFILLVSLVGAAISGFLWWKRREVERAESVSRDPWPSVVAEATVSPPRPTAPATQLDAPQKVQSSAGAESSHKPPAKKAVKKVAKKAAKKVDADPSS
jgi:hypothetical protein